MPPRRLRKTGESMGTFAERQQSFVEGGKLPRSKKVVYWPLSSPSGDDMARSGFHYTPTKQHTDCVTCFSCHRQEFDWPVITEDMKMLDGTEQPPAIRHLQNSPDCAFANVVVPFLQNEHGSIEFDSWKHNVIFKDPTSEKGYQYRLETFKQGGWNYNKIPSMEDLAASGFFYSPSSLNDDLTTCMYCGRQLEGWEESDNVDEEHHAKSKNCYIFEFRESQKMKDQSSEGYLESRRSSKLRRSLRRRSRSFSSSFMFTDDNELKSVNPEAQDLSSEELTITKEVQLPTQIKLDRDQNLAQVKQEDDINNYRAIEGSTVMTLLDQSTDNELEMPNIADEIEMEKSVIYNNELSILANNNQSEYDGYDDFDQNINNVDDDHDDGDDSVKIITETPLTTSIKAQYNRFGVEEEVINMDENLDLTIRTGGSDDRDEVEIPLAILDDRDDTWFREDMSTSRGATFFGRAKVSSNRYSYDTSAIAESNVPPSSPVVTRLKNDSKLASAIVPEAIAEEEDDINKEEVLPSNDVQTKNDNSQMDDIDFGGNDDETEDNENKENVSPEITDSSEKKDLGPMVLSSIEDSKPDEGSSEKPPKRLKMKWKGKLLEKKLIEVDETIKKVEELKKEYEMKLKEVDERLVETDSENLSKKSKKRSKKHKKKHNKRQRNTDGTYISGQDLKIESSQEDKRLVADSEELKLDSIVEEPNVAVTVAADSGEIKPEPEEDVVMEDVVIEAIVDMRDPELADDIQASQDVKLSEALSSAETTEIKQDAIEETPEISSVGSEKSDEVSEKSDENVFRSKRMYPSAKLVRTTADGVLIPSDDPLLLGFGSKPPRRRKLFQRIIRSSGSSKPPSSEDDKENQDSSSAKKTAHTDVIATAPRRVPLKPKDHNIQVTDSSAPESKSVETKSLETKTSEIKKFQAPLELEEQKEVMVTADIEVEVEADTSNGTPKDPPPTESESVLPNSVVDDDEEIILDNGYFENDDDEEIILDNGYFVSSPPKTLGKINVFSDAFRSSANKFSRILSRSNTPVTIGRVEVDEEHIRNRFNTSALKSNLSEPKSSLSNIQEPTSEKVGLEKISIQDLNLSERSMLEKMKSDIEVGDIEVDAGEHEKSEEEEDKLVDDEHKQLSETSVNGKMVPVDEVDLSAGEVGDDEKDEDISMTHSPDRINIAFAKDEEEKEKEKEKEGDIQLKGNILDGSISHKEVDSADDEEEELSNARIRSSDAFKLYKSNDHQFQHKTPRNPIIAHIEFSSAPKDQSTPPGFNMMSRSSASNGIEESPLDHKDITGGVDQKLLSGEHVDRYEPMKKLSFDGKVLQDQSEALEARDEPESLVFEWKPTDNLLIEKHLDGLSDAQEYLESIMKSGYSTLYDDLDGKLTDFIASMPQEELQMTIGEWIDYTAEQAAEEFKRRGQAMLNDLKHEHTRAIKAMEAVEEKMLLSNRTTNKGDVERKMYTT